MSYLLISIFSLSLMILLMPLLQRLAVHIGAVDRPDERKVHTVPVPRIGGVLIAFSFILTILLFLPLTQSIRGILVAALMISALGLTDDLIGLKPWVKFAVQWLAAAFFIGVTQPVLDLPLVGSSPWLTWPLAGFFIVFLTNAINLQDGLDGLASGLVIIGALAMGVYLTYSGEWLTVKVLISLAAAVVGFLRVNTRPARIFMGDAGSYLLGFVLAAVFLINVSSGKLPLWTALFFFAIPIGDTLQVMLRRALAGVRIFTADKRHLHHMLLAGSLSHGHVVYVEYMIASSFALMPMLLLSPLKLRWLGLLLILSLLVVLLLQKNLRNAVHMDALPAGNRLDRVMTSIVLGCVALLYLIELVFVQDLSIKYGLLPALLAGGYAFWSWFRLKGTDPSRLSITMALIVGAHFFILHQFGFGIYNLHRPQAIVYYGLGLVMLGATGILFLRRFYTYLFISNPIEYFLIYGSILLFFLPVPLKARFSTDLLGIELLCFFFVFRVLSQNMKLQGTSRLHALAVVSLVLVLLRGFLL